MEKFSEQKKGYDKLQVDNYIKGIVSQYEKTIFDQRDRIEELKRDNYELASKLKDYESRQDSINEALTQAIEKAKNIEYASKVRFALEGERIKMFESKWTSHCKTFLNKIGNRERAYMGEYLKETKEELASLMATELNITDDVSQNNVAEDFIEESIRLKCN